MGVREFGWGRKVTNGIGPNPENPAVPSGGEDRTVGIERNIFRITGGNFHPGQVPDDYRFLQGADGSCSRRCQA